MKMAFIKLKEKEKLDNLNQVNEHIPCDMRIIIIHWCWSTQNLQQAVAPRMMMIMKIKDINGKLKTTKEKQPELK